ncbi:MAG TPA: hypothetical protein ENJ95_23390 [Bacteroidetes bacterium]|nr:hypothetical protein [Bacteroidota bacterium]
MAKDLFHEHVKEALEKDGWEITHDPYTLKHLEQGMEIDLGAEKIIAAERKNIKIAVEIKSFLSHSRFYDYHEALGQYHTYRRILSKKDIDRNLFLAVPEDAYEDFFTSPFGLEAIREENLDIVVFNPKSKTIVSWII